MVLGMTMVVWSSLQCLLSSLYVFSHSLTILVTRTSCCHPRPDRGSRVMFFCPSIYAPPPGTKNPWIPD